MKVALREQCPNTEFFHAVWESDFSDDKFYFTFNSRDVTLCYFSAHRTLGRNKAGGKSIDEQSKIIWRGPIASLIVSKKNSFKQQLHYNIEEKRLLNYLQKMISFHVSNFYNIYHIFVASPWAIWAWFPQILQALFYSNSSLGDTK